MKPGIELAGPMGAPPLVLLHGASANRKMWVSQTRALSDTYRVVVPDLPGHGGLQDRRFRFDDAVEYLQGIIDTEAGGRAVIVGTSAGGYVAIGVAQRSPERVRALVLSGATAEYRGWGAISTRAFGVASLAAGRLMRRQAEAAIRRVAPGDVAEAIIGLGVSMRGASQSLFTLPGRDYHAMLERFDGPVLILNGERDAPNRAREEAAARRWNAQLETIEDAGHACVISKPEAVTDAVRRFVDALGP